MPFQQGTMMSNKPHLHPHQKKQQARRTTRLLVAILVLAVFALAIALEMTGHVVFRGRLILSVNPLIARLVGHVAGAVASLARSRLVPRPRL